MKNIIATRFVIAVVCLFYATAVNAQTLVYGITFDEGNNKKIISVLPGGAAEKAGIQAGDIVNAINYKSTAAMDNAAVRALLGTLDEAAITVERNGFNKTIRVRKAPIPAMGQVCVSGNCQTGQGRLRIGSTNFEYEGQFNNGVLTGETKIYSNNGSLVYKGDVVNFKPDGNGKIYGKDASGNPVILEEGNFDDGYLLDGIKYNTDGTVAVLGQFDPVTHQQKGVFRTTMFQGKRCVIACENIRRGPNGPIYNGKLRIREREEDNRDARILLEMTYVDGIPNGIAKAYDYANNVYHFIQLRNGIPRDDGLNAGIIDRISDGHPLASEVRYSAASVSSGDFINGITYGLFHLGSQFRAITGPSAGAGMADYKEAYNKGYGQVFDPFAPPGSYPNNGGGNSGDGQGNPMAGVDPKYSPADVTEALRQCTYRMQYLKTQEDRLATVASGIGRHNYDRARRQFESLQLDIVIAYDKALDDFKGRIPSKSYNLIESRRNRIKALQVPSYVQY